jgi:hypothetical protein
LYPYQTVTNYISGIIGIQNIVVTATQLTSFDTTSIIIYLMCNIDISANQYLYIDFPSQFDNFNNKALNVILKTSLDSIIGTLNAVVLGQRL